MASYGLGKYLAEFFIGAFGALVYKYYETEIGLPGGYCAAAILVYSAWNAVNDPLIGYLTAKPTRLSGKLGRRFPWIIGAALLWGFSFLAIFAVPAGLEAETAPLPVFLWMVVTICIFDLLFSTWEVNYQSVFPDKFREARSREKAAGIATVVGVFGIVAGTIVPTRIISYGIASTYLTNAWVFLGVGLVVALLMIPGVREDGMMIRRYLESWKREKAASFFSQLRDAFKQRSFVAFILLYFFYQSAAMCMTGSIHYVGDFVLPGGSRDMTIVFAAMLGGALVSVPLWLFLIRKIGSNQRLMIFTCLWMAAAAFPMTFVNGYTGFAVFMALWGLGFGGFWMFMTPAMADVIDEVVIRRGRRDDGVYLGFRAFFGRLSYASQALVFWAIHEATGFASDPRSASAAFGIKLHLAAIPAAFFIAGVVVFLWLNDLTPEKIRDHRSRLSEMDL